MYAEWASLDGGIKVRVDVADEHKPDLRLAVDGKTAQQHQALFLGTEVTKFLLNYQTQPHGKDS